MKSPDEIKKGLECCKVGISWGETCARGCPYKNAPVPGGRCEMALLKDALALIQQLEANAQNWISTKDRKPAAKSTVLAVVGVGKNRHIEMACYGYHLKSKDWWSITYGNIIPAWNVTYWQPIPELPKELTS